MQPSQFIQFKALQLKMTVEGSSPSLFDSILENPVNSEALKSDFRNVCALIHQLQFQRLEEVCDLLDLSKRSVIVMALDHFFPLVDSIVSEVKPFEHEARIKSILENK
jgi:hypothetical protein